MFYLFLYRNETLERPLTIEDLQYIEYDLGILFRCLSALDFQLPPNEVRVALREVLIKLAQRMKNEWIDGYKLYDSEHQMSPMAKHVMKLVYGRDYPDEAYERINRLYDYKLMPAGVGSPSVFNN